MIRINLLPGARATGRTRKHDVRQQVVVAGGLLVLAVAICFYYAGMLDRRMEVLQVSKQEKQKQLALLQEKLKQVQDFEQRKKLLEDKNRIIDQLERSRSGPVRVLDYVSHSLEPVKLWLTRLTLKENAIELEGRALTNDDVVEFVNNLRQTDYFTNVRLIESRAAVEVKTNIFQFKLSMMLKG
jgi:type IV pilus assembly protein PilN